VIEPSRTATGRFCWQDLAAADMAAALRFYGIVFGWTSTVQRANGGCFTRLQSGGHDVASMYALSDAHLARGVPSHWTPYVHVERIEDTLRRVHDAGGCACGPSPSKPLPASPDRRPGRRDAGPVGDPRAMSRPFDVTIVMLDGGFSSTAIGPMEVFYAAGLLWHRPHGEPEHPRFKCAVLRLTDGRSRASTA
jgi:predicted enzyme related to lactoylglutathione lyase